MLVSELSLEQVVDNVMAGVVEAPAPVVEDAAPAATPETPVAATPETPAAPAPASLSDDALVEVIVDGKPIQMPWKEARSNISLHAASTKRFQDAAEQRRQAEALAAQAQQAIQQAQYQAQQFQSILQDEQKLAAVYMAMKAQQTGQPVAQQQAPAPIDLQAFAQHIMTQADQLVQTRLAEVQQREVEAKLVTDLTAFTNSLLSDDPILSTVPGFSDKVYETVSKMGPRSVDEAKEWIRAQVHEVKAKLAATTGEAQKASVVAKAKAANATERGGSPVLPTPHKYENLQDPNMTKDMLAFLNQL